ncbi:Druantia anti-phage system protein DruA, partial [Ferrimicrobium acidiphilum]
THIGWDKATREARLHLVVGNARFLILPQVRVVNLASYILSRVIRRLPGDWQLAYGYQPVLLTSILGTAYSNSWVEVSARWEAKAEGPSSPPRDRQIQFGVACV